MRYILPLASAAEGGVGELRHRVRAGWRGVHPRGAVRTVERTGGEERLTDKLRDVARDVVGFCGLLWRATQRSNTKHSRQVLVAAMVILAAARPEVGRWTMVALAARPEVSR